MSGSGTSIFCLGEPAADYADRWQASLLEPTTATSAFPWPVKVRLCSARAERASRILF
jgi:hypothetical protein